MATTFGKRLQELRNSKKMTQADLGKVLKISASTVGMYETDKRQPNFEIEEAIAHAIVDNMPINYVALKNKFIIESRKLAIKYPDTFL